MDMGQVLKVAAPIIASLFVATAARATNFAMPTQGATTQPIGHYEFCQRLPGECEEMTPHEAPIKLTRKMWAQMIQVNNSVNQRIKPMTDLQNYGVEEYWSYPTDGYGDCEDYALAKRKALIAANLSPRALRIAVARSKQGEAHAVLTVATDRGDYVLDNLTNTVLPWNETNLSWIAREAPGQAQWALLDAGAASNIVVASTALHR